MKKYSHDMSGESSKNVLLPEGWHKFKIVKCIESISKQGNDMFIFSLQDEKTKQVKEVYAIATQGKRWFLKSILAACDVSASQDGVYDWNISDVENQVIMGHVEYFDDTWINREGKTVTAKKDKIVEIMGKDIQLNPKEGTFEVDHGEDAPPIDEEQAV